MRELLRRAWYVVRRRRFEAELKEELDQHRRLKQQELERRGIGADDALARPRRAMGNT